MTDTGQVTCVIQTYIFVPFPDILVYFTCAFYLKITDFTQSVWYNSLDHPQYMGPRDGPDYRAVRTAEVKLRGIGNVHKIITQYTLQHCYSTIPSGGNTVPKIL